VLFNSADVSNHSTTQLTAVGKTCERDVHIHILIQCLLHITVTFAMDKRNCNLGLLRFFAKVHEIQNKINWTDRCLLVGLYFTCFMWFVCQESSER